MPGVTDWTAFLATEVGASAALAGLIFVGVSINLKSIVSPQSPALPNRALEALLALLAALILASLLLIPVQPQVVIGVEILVVGVATWVALTVIQVRDWLRTSGEYRRIFWARAPDSVGLAALHRRRGQYLEVRLVGRVLSHRPGSRLLLLAGLPQHLDIGDRDQSIACHRAIARSHPARPPGVSIMSIGHAPLR